VLGGGASRPRSGYRSLPDAVIIIKAKDRRAGRRGLLGSE